MPVPKDTLRETLFASVRHKKYTAVITATQTGYVYGISDACSSADEAGIFVMPDVADGMFVHAGDAVMTVSGTAEEIAYAEETIIGSIAKLSGIATAASRAVHIAKGRVEIVSGSFKKIPAENRKNARRALECMGVTSRITTEPFIYLDKNTIRMMGGTEKAIGAAKAFNGRLCAVQVFGFSGDIGDEAVSAAEYGADIIMIDTGDKANVKTVLDALTAKGLRSRVKVAFAGDVQMDDIDELADTGLDTVCLGKAIIDAPLLDMRLSVISEESDYSHHGMPMHLLNKTEINIENIVMDRLNLTEVADVAAEVLGFEKDEILVVDVRHTYLTLDVLKPVVDGEAIADKEKELISRLSELDGITVTEETCISSAGILGLIASDNKFLEEEKYKVSEIVKAANEAAMKKVLIIPTGFELQSDMIEDTNSVFLKEELEKKGYKADIAPPAEDSLHGITGALYRGVNSGYGTVITTGGVGAEDKDFTVEAVLELDPDALTPWLAKFRAGHGRHKKNGIRIAVGELDNTLIISLPGPNDEVRVAFDSIRECFEERNKYELARNIAVSLRQNYSKGKGIHKHHHHG